MKVGDWRHRELLTCGPLLKPIYRGESIAFIQASWNRPPWPQGRRGSDMRKLHNISRTCCNRSAVKDTRKRKIWVESRIWVCDVLAMSGCAQSRDMQNHSPTSFQLLPDMICGIAKGDSQSLLYSQYLENWRRHPWPGLIISWLPYV